MAMEGSLQCLELFPTRPYPQPHKFIPQLQILLKDQVQLPMYAFFSMFASH